MIFSAEQDFKPMFKDVITPVSHDGTVSFIYPAVFKITCSPDVRHFPFDQQTCALNFMSWAYDGTAVDLQLPGKI